MNDRPSFAEADTTAPDETIVVARYATRAEARERSTVLLAKDIPHWTAETPDGVVITVPFLQAGAALGQLSAYDAETLAAAQEPPPVEAPVFRQPVWPGLLFATVALSFVHYFKTHGHEWIDEAWARDGTAIFQRGEWWRVFTALVVHSDLSHLLGNLSFGGLFVYFVLRAYGRSAGWAATVLAGGLGNLMVAALFYPRPFAGIGASTAVFAATGLLVAHGLAWTRWSRSARGHRAWLVPLGGGLALLGLFGSGGENTDVDVAAHLFGFVAGLAAGLPLAWWQKQRFFTRKVCIEHVEVPKSRRDTRD